jgi:hypothetical protein
MVQFIFSLKDYQNQSEKTKIRGYISLFLNHPVFNKLFNEERNLILDGLLIQVDFLRIDIPRYTAIP